mgnify:CR=1 FL=1
MITQSDILNLVRESLTDGSEGGVAGRDITFTFSGRRWMYRSAYDRYVLIEQLADGREMTVDQPEVGGPVMMWEPTWEGAKDVSHADPDAARLFAARELLDTLAGRYDPEKTRDRTGYHKGDVNL